MDRLRETFEAFWTEYGSTGATNETLAQWNSIRIEFQKLGLSLPSDYNGTPFNGVVSLMLSAKYGRPFGYRHERLIQVAHTAFDHYKQFLLPFGWALQAYGHQAVLDSQDTKGNWAKRRKEIREGIATKDPKYLLNTEFDLLIGFLVPKIKDKLSEDEDVDCDEVNWE